ncbi:MAG: polyprenyl synthetase family protein [Clostridia bacterium]|nr:polyprenyl synthetase family protein [Clostridia bacterium]MBQ1895721.1 polyprenyl synthetase family protein [Clostridia bacterium]MBQ2091858.1 polyprenyl synthetase family protein [Clostridia bacterium]MBQ2500340.1 polyprenyl synthetase family protein [Clostridia bacterium]MBQ3897776.1 polyprenyl synthetase family protein [Clostridia bacterium]
MGSELLSAPAFKHYTSLVNLVNATLGDYLSINNMPYQVVADAMQYSVEIGGKRVRPLLVLEFCRICGGNISDALPFACALELIHTYSLVHDDLPAMDNDSFRRGKESTWKKYGEAYGILTGDALLTYAFQIASDAGVSDHTTTIATRCLANYAGIFGMIGGQTLDLQNEVSEEITLDDLRETHRLKTGALIRCACELGCAAADASSEQFEAAKVYAENLGLAFQITDDILDVIGNPEVLGKEVGQDAANGKVTYVTLLGVEEAEKLAAVYTQNALDALDAFDDVEYLREATKYLLNREN